MINRLRLILFGLEIGFWSIMRGDYTIGLKRVILPINYWRVSIFSYVAEYVLKMIGNAKGDIRVLDIASPKLLSLYLANRIKGTVHATDLNDEMIFTEWKRHYRNMPNKNNLVFRYENAKDLAYPPQCFDLVYSISVIHMITPAESGDIIALREIQKKIKPGGSLIIEVPYRIEYAVNYQEKNNFEEIYSGSPLFKERQYNDAAIESRISANIDGDLKEIVKLGERVPFDKIWSRMPKWVKYIFAFIEPWADLFNVSTCEDQNNSHKVRSIILFYEMRK